VCVNTPPDSPRFWRDHPRAGLRDWAWRRIQETAGYGLKFSKLVNELHGQEAIRQADYDYTHLREFVRELRREDYVRIERIGPHERPQDRPLWIFPMVTPGESVLDTASGITVSASNASGSDAKRNAAVLLSSRRSLSTAGVWGDLVGAFAGKRLGEQRAPGGPESTRWNSAARALSGRDRVATAFEGALTEYEHGVLVS
jgi:hypothetical protein